MSRLNFSIIAINLLVSCIVLADILPPSYKWVSSSAQFENLADYPDYLFFVAHHPDRDFRGHDGGSKTGEAFSIDSVRLDPVNAVVGLGGNPMLGPKYLLAVPKKLVDKPDAKAMSDWFQNKTPGVLQQVIDYGYRSVPESEKRNEFRIVYRVNISKDTSDTSSLNLEIVSADTPGSETVKEEESPTGLPAPASVRWSIAGGVGLAALAMIVGWLFLFRRR